MATADDKKARDESAAESDEAADELPDRLVILTGAYSSFSIRLDRGPVHLSDQKGCTLQLHPVHYRGTSLIISRTSTPDGGKRFAAFDVGGHAIFNGKVRARQFNLHHGSTIEIAPSLAGSKPLRFKLAEEGRYVREDGGPSWWWDFKKETTA